MEADEVRIIYELYQFSLPKNLVGGRAFLRSTQASEPKFIHGTRTRQCRAASVDTVYTPMARV